MNRKLNNFFFVIIGELAGIDIMRYSSSSKVKIKNDKLN
jgi:hypothetical protein